MHTDTRRTRIQMYKNTETQAYAQANKCSASLASSPLLLESRFLAFFPSFAAGPRRLNEALRHRSLARSFPTSPPLWVDPPSMAMTEHQNRCRRSEPVVSRSRISLFAGSRDARWQCFPRSGLRHGPEAARSEAGSRGRAKV